MAREAAIAELQSAALRERRAAEATWSGRFSDRALVQRRWPPLGTHPAFARGEWPAADGRAAEPGEMERMLAAMLCGRGYERERLTVLDIASASDLRAADARADACGFSGALRYRPVTSRR